MTPLLLVCTALVAENVVAVGLEGTAPLAERTRAHGLLVEALRGVEGLEVVAIADPAAMLGAAVQQRLASCADDRCRVAALAPVAHGPVVFGALTSLGPGSLRLELRVATASAGATVRVSRDVTGPLEPVLIESAGTLFPGRAVRPTAQLTVRVDVAGAAISLDGTPIGVAPLSPLEVVIGRHEVQASLPDGRSANAVTVLSLGGTQAVELSLGTPRTALPYLIAGGAALLAGGGLALGLVADGTASQWRDACPAGASCAAGFSRTRYDADADAVDVQRTMANVLFVGASSALVAATVLWFVEGTP